MRKILKPGISGNQSAASEDTKVRTAAGTSPLISRLIACVAPALRLTSVAPAVAIAVRTLSLDADCLSSIATSLPFRSDTDLISGRVMRRTTRRSVLFGDADAFLPGWIVSERSERSVLSALCSGAGTAAAAVTCSATAVAAVTCSCIVLVPKFAAAPAFGGEAAISAGIVTDLATAFPAVSGGACNDRGASGMRKILKPAISGNHVAVSGCAEVRTAAGTSPLINRSIALV